MEEIDNTQNVLSSKDFLLSIEEAQECLRVANLLQSHAQIIQKEKEDIFNKVTEAKTFIAAKQDILNFLQKLQSALHKKNIDVFSQLLTYFVQDVLKTNKEVRLDLFTSRGMPALNIEALNNGNPENIYVGNGGSMSNIVSTGLRLIALSRLNHRKFIVLDEPDCWLEVDNVPLFAKTIGEIAHKLKIQTLMISHHHWSYFKQYARVIELKEEGTFLTTEVIHDLDWDIPENLNYISSIRMQDVMSHTDTIYNLSPYMNCIVGKNNIGKSVVAAALKAVTYNDSSDSYISHHKSVARVLISLSNATSVLWERTRDTSPEFPQKVRYTLFKNNNMVAQEYNSDTVPTFIQKELNVALAEDIDVHINNQKEPVFLLGSSVKPQDRAKILSLGKESLMIQKLMELVRTKSRNNSSIIKNGEERHDALVRQLTVLENIDSMVETLELSRKDLQNALEKFSGLEKMKEDVNSLKELKSIVSVSKIDFEDVEVERFNVEAVEKDIGMLETLLKMSKLEKVKVNTADMEFELLPEDELAYDIKILSNLLKSSKLENLNVNELQDIKFNDTLQLEKDLDILDALLAASQLSKTNVNDLKIEFVDTDTLENDIKQLDFYKSEVKKWKDYKLKGEKLAKEVQAEIDDFIEKNGGVCETCGQPLSEKHLGGEHD